MIEFDYFDFNASEEVDQDTSSVQVPSFERPSGVEFSLDDFLDLDEEVQDYDYTRENFTRAQKKNEYREGSSVTLRKYQQQATDSVFSEWSKGNWSTEVVMATATGKTFVIAAVASQYQDFFGLRPDGNPRRGLILVHRDYLMHQIANSCAAMGLETSMEQGKKKALGGLFDDPTLVIAMVQSMQNNKKSSRLSKWPRDYFDFIITDEGHHGPSETYRSIYSYFRPYCSHRLFLTATPTRNDNESLEDLCHSRAFVFDIADAARYQPPCICTSIQVRYCETRIDISKIRTTGLDLNEHDIAEAIKPYIQTIARATKVELQDRTAIGFWPDVGSSQAMASALVSLGIKAAHLDGESKNRQQVIDGFRNGLYQVLCNCALFGEGFDLPDVSCIILGRPTESEGLYKQMVGRGLRKKTGKHKDLILIDFPWVAGRHSLIKPADIFKSNIQEEEVFNQAAAILETEGGTDDLMAVLTRADQEIRERREIRVKAEDGKVKYHKIEYDPLGIHAPGNQQDGSSRESDRPIKEPLTQKQFDILVRNGIDGAEYMSKKRAGKLIGMIFERRDRGLATFPMVQTMIRNGVDPKTARSVSFNEARQLLDNLVGTRT